jgi:hypothetical protein
MKNESNSRPDGAGYHGVELVFEEMRQAMHSAIEGITWPRLLREGAVTYPCLSADVGALAVVAVAGTAGWFSLDKETRGLLATRAHQPRPAVLEPAAARRGLSRAGPAAGAGQVRAWWRPVARRGRCRRGRR